MSKLEQVVKEPSIALSNIPATQQNTWYVPRQMFTILMLIVTSFLWLQEFLSGFPFP